MNLTKGIQLLKGTRHDPLKMRRISLLELLVFS